jgi:glycosyltransferase involved in cell wall biosynthesis
MGQLLARYSLWPLKLSIDSKKAKRESSHSIQRSRGLVKFIVLSRHYPPERAGGSRRPSALVAGLRALGHEVLVVAPTGADDSELLGVPHPVFPHVTDPSEHDSNQNQLVGNWMRRWLLLPDPEIRWALRAAKAIRKTDFLADWLITTSPPESLHVVGALLKKQLGVKWLADVRDLWLKSPQLSMRRHVVRRWIESHLARRCLTLADALIGVSPTVLAEAQELSGKPNIPSVVIGHFAMPYSGARRQLPRETFNIVHTGAVGLSNPLSDIAPLLADFEALAQQRPDAHLWLAGRLLESEAASLRRSSAAQKITILGLLENSDARALQAGADALAIVSGPNSHALPGKFSEYQTTGIPILLAGSGPWTSLVPSGAALAFNAAADLPKRTNVASRNYDAQELPHIKAAQSLIDLVTEIGSAAANKST